MSQKHYRAGAIGHTGAGNYGHGLHLAYRYLESVEFIAVADPDHIGRQKAVEETNALRSYADYSEMLEREDLDIVSVCPRWVTNHVEVVLACLEADCHVYCEKPMTATLADGDLIVDMAAQKDLKVAVSHQGVYFPSTYALKQLLQDEKIGQVESIRAHGKQDGRGGGEDMITLGTHAFNMMRFLVGDVDWMSAHVTEVKEEVGLDHVRVPTEPVGPVAGDCIESYFAFKSGVTGFYDSRKDRFGRGGMEIYGSEGIISPNIGRADQVAICLDPCWRIGDPSQQWEMIEICDLPLKSEESLDYGNHLAIVDLIEAIEQNRQPLSSASDAVAALEMIVGAYQSQLTKARVSFPIKNRQHPLSH